MTVLHNQKMARRLHTVIQLCWQEVQDLILFYQLPEMRNTDITVAKAVPPAPLDMLEELDSD